MTRGPVDHGRTIVIGIGNDFRQDDAAGLEVARALRLRRPAGVEIQELDGEPVGLLDAWSGAATAYVVDAVASDDPPGTIHHLDIIADDGKGVPSGPRHDSSHALGLGEAVALGRALDRLPHRLVLIGITGSSFESGTGMSELVRAAVDRVVAELAGVEVES